LPKTDEQQPETGVEDIP